MKSASLPLVSVLTPVYNGERYLAECIESVLAQTYQNWEYIIVNNCSTDRTLEIAEKYAEKNARIRIHNNDRFLTVIQNHNHAVRLISHESKYCKVVQADDWLFPECIERMVEVAESSPPVGIVGSYRLEETEVSCDGLPYPSTIVSGKEICRLSLLGGLYVFGSPTTLLMRSDLIRSHKHLYNENNLHADVEACYAVLKDHDFGYVHQVLSFTRRHNETETARAKRLKTYLLGNLTVLTKYGPAYLSEQEHAEILKKKLKEYYRSLGRSIFETRAKEFWDYHKEGMRELGYALSMAKILREAVIILYNRILDRIVYVFKIH
jgi:glycosyltransferase involved in cell wall biosynthesis